MVFSGRMGMRLSGYDYRQPGFYFVTLCVKDRLPVWGEIKNGNMHLNDAGKMVDAYWHALSEKYTNIDVDVHVVMPDHMHGIIRIRDVRIDGARDAGVDQCVDPLLNSCTHDIPLSKNAFSHSFTQQGGHVGPPLRPHLISSSIPDVIRWFKTMTTNAYIRGVKNFGWSSFSWKLWQRTYHERIIRNDGSLERIRAYIRNNPKNCEHDILSL